MGCENEMAHGGTEGRFQFITVNFDKKSIKKLASFMKCHYLLQLNRLNYRRYNNDVRYECTKNGSCSFLE